MSTNPGRAPIFIHSTLGRSGTNYLARMLALHPQCSLSPIPEDYLLAESHWLANYVSAISRQWRRDPTWKVAPGAEEVLMRHLGDGLASFLGRETGDGEAKRPITKTPNVLGLANFFRLFPDAHLLLLVRDGRSVVESFTRSFGRDPNQVTRWWAWAADRVHDFDCTYRNTDRKYRIIRYEDLVSDPAAGMAGILRFLDLDADRYDFSQIQKLPVFGSSTTRGESGEWTWKMSPDAGDLNSIKRWREWSRGQHERFNWSASHQLEKFGYEVQRFPDYRWAWFGLTLGWAIIYWFRQVGWRLAETFKRLS